MKTTTRLLAHLFLAAGTLFSGSLLAQTKKAEVMPQVSSDWRYSVEPYLWLTNISGSVYYGDSELGSTRIGADNVLSHLNIGGMLELEAHKGDMGVMADLMYASLSSTSSTPAGPRVSPDAKTSVTQGIYTMAATYTVAKSTALYTDVFLGARVVMIGSRTNFNINGKSPLNLTVTTNTTLTDPVIGLKGRARISDSDWFIPFYVDIGGGGNSEITTQAFAGLGRTFDWGDAVLGVKNLYFNQKNQGLTTNTDLFGIALGAVFRF